MTLPYQPAFRCQKCGHLCGPEQAGIFQTPTRCSVCDSPSFEVLAQADPERLAELGLSPEQVAHHEPLSDEQDQAANKARCEETLAALEQKRSQWDEHKGQIVARVFALDDAHESMTRSGPRSDHPRHIDEHVTALSNNRQEAAELMGLEWSENDERLRTELEETIAAGGKAPTKYRPGGGGGTNVARALERTGTFDRSKGS
jgi:hypothetical protein